MYAEVFPHRFDARGITCWAGGALPAASGAMPSAVPCCGSVVGSPCSGSVVGSPCCRRLRKGEAEHAEHGFSVGLSHFTPVSRPEKCAINTGRRGTSVQAGCANAVQMQILLEDIPCKQVSIYSGDMSHLLRYHGYSISSPLSTISISQYFALALVQRSGCFAPGDSPSSLSWRELEPRGV